MNTQPSSSQNLAIRPQGCNPQIAESGAQHLGHKPALSLVAGGKGTGPTVAGLVKMSTTDWPGKLAAVVFLQGCPWRCVYCHNEAILDPKAPGIMPWSDVMKFLQKRRGLLDGVVFSGGEPLIDAALPDAIREVRALGFAIGLHTGGAWPKRLAALLGSTPQIEPVGIRGANPLRHSAQGALAPQSQNPESLVDWVGLDIKQLKAKYSSVTGVKVSGRSAFASLDIVLNSGVPHEVRTTVDPTVHTHDDVVALIAELKEYRSANGGIVQKHVLQEARANGAAANHADELNGWRLRHLIAEHEASGVQIRAA